MLLLIAGVVPPIAACTNFQNPTSVIDLRILAVNVEPSEIILDVDLSNPAMPVVDPANNPPIMVTPLIVDPAGRGREVTYTVSACPNNPFAPAPPGSGAGPGAFPSGGARTTVGSALCDPNSPNTWPLTPAPVVVDLADPLKSGVSVPIGVDQLTTAFMTDIFPDQFGNLHGGFDLGMPLTLDIKVDAGGEEIRGIKRVLYWARRIDDAQKPNQTPRIDSLGVFRRDDYTLQPLNTPVPIDEKMPYKLDGGVTRTWIMPSDAVAEPYETTVIDPNTHQAIPYSVARETLRLRWYTDLGSFSPGVTSTEVPPGFVVTDHIHLEAEYIGPPDDKITTDADGHAIATIWVVISDDRGGESWITRQLQLTPVKSP
jgi:hypothetical protein